MIDNMHRNRRIFLVIVYMIIFLFSVYSIIQIRYTVSQEQIQDEEGQFVFMFVGTRPMTHHQFVLAKISIFVFVACVSFIFMVSEYHVYHHPKFHHRVMKKTHKEIKEHLEAHKREQEELKKT